MTNRHRAAAALLLLVMAAALVAGALQETQTWDEGIHVTASYLYLTTGRTAFFIDHPPLRAIFSLPLLFLHLHLPYDRPEWAQHDKINSATWFLYTNPYHPDTILLAARSVAIALTLAFGAVLAWWTHRHFGPRVALTALLFFAFDPNLIAHGHYATNDMLSAFTFFLAAIAWAAYLSSPTRHSLWLSGGALGLAFTAKLSAIALLPIFVLLGAAAWWQGRIALRRLSWSVAAALAIAMLVVLLAYAPETWRWLTGVEPRHPFLAEMSEILRFSREGHEEYLLGMISHTGWWYYFPVVFAVKTPLGLLALCGAGILACRAGTHAGTLSGGSKGSFAWFTMSIPAAAFFAISMTSAINLGVRHLLPIYPMLCVLGAALVFRLKRGPLVAAICSAVLICESVSIYPNYLAFFNAAAGGPKAGPRYLLDSNIDWGQDVKKLRAWLRARHIDSVCMFYFGTTGVEFYGVPMKYLPRTWETAARDQLDCVAAISVTNLYDLYVPRGSYAWLRAREPAARIGWSIYVYDLRKHPTAPL